MKRCLITYEPISEDRDYSSRGLHALASKLNNLKPLAWSAEEQRKEAIALVGKMSIQGVQPKLSAQLNAQEECFAIVDQYGHFILKPPSEHYWELPENEAITMSLAAEIGIDIPLHGLIRSADNSLTYFVKRFDRIGLRKKVALEDFSQLSNHDRLTKYESSMEKLVSIIENYCTFPKIELVKLFKLTLFNFLIGNEDMHLKNFSLMTQNQKTCLSPGYDLLNSTIAMGYAKEEIALPLNGKTNQLKRKDFVAYFAVERLGLNQNVITVVLEGIKKAMPRWKALLECSFLSHSMQERYLQLLEARAKRLEL